MRQVVLDTETTGLEVELQHRIIEIGCVELNNRRITGRHFHKYVNPERDIDQGAELVHGLSRDKLSGAPKFSEICAELLEFIQDAELIIHNAPFDLGFLNAEFARLDAHNLCAWDRVLDTLALARQIHPGQRNSLDALCKRYCVDNSQRDYHGALLDARLLAEVYLAMTGGQVILTLGAESDTARSRARHQAAPRGLEEARIVIVKACDEELAAHQHVLALLDKASGGNTVWRKL
jgi:DNA polymerase-3 subunit epsilon